LYYSICDLFSTLPLKSNSIYLFGGSVVTFLLESD